MSLANPATEPLHHPWLFHLYILVYLSIELALFDMFRKQDICLNPNDINWWRATQLNKYWTKSMLNLYNAKRKQIEGTDSRLAVGNEEMTQTFDLLTQWRRAQWRCVTLVDGRFGQRMFWPRRFALGLFGLDLLASHIF